MRPALVDFLNECARALVLDSITGESVVAWAARALELGADTPAFWDLAGLSDLRLEDSAPLFEKCLAEYDVVVPTPEEAGLYRAKTAAQRTLDGSEEPFDFLVAISDLSWGRKPVLCGIAMWDYDLWIEQRKAYVEGRRVNVEKFAKEPAAEILAMPPGNAR